MSAPPIYVGYSVRIELDVGVDVSAATQTDILVRRPDGTTQVLTGTVDPAVPTVIAADLTPSQAGVYYLQPRVVTGGQTQAGAIVSIRAIDPIQ